MFTTVEHVKEITGYDVTTQGIIMAQVIIESIIGKVEAEVNDANDLAILGRATAFQAAYMTKNYDSVYEQVAVTVLGQTDGTVALDTTLLSPYMAPLALFSIRNLSWNRSRSVKTGRLFGRGKFVEWVRD